MVREPVVAGQFYPGGCDALLSELDSLIPGGAVRTKVIGAVVPHAGYMYSGGVAGEVYARIDPPETYVLIGPNHTGFGARFACSDEAWRTPLGEVDVDDEFISAVLAGTDLLKRDTAAHAAEHSLEVQLPFIQKTAPGTRIVPITVRSGDAGILSEIAEAVVAAAKTIPRRVTILASSDMTHYETRVSARAKDLAATQKVLELDPRGLMETVERKGITMCGYIPAVIMLMCAGAMGATGAELVKYSDSGEVTGDTGQVVGYAGIIVT